MYRDGWSSQKIVKKQIFIYSAPLPTGYKPTCNLLPIQLQTMYEGNYSADVMYIQDWGDRAERFRDRGVSSLFTFNK